MRKRSSLYLLSFLLLILITLVGCTQNGKKPGGKEGSQTGNQDTQQTSPDTEGEAVGDPVDTELQVKSIQFSFFDQDGREGEFKVPKGFNKKAEGPYEFEQKATTAYIGVNVEMPADNDFQVHVSNENSYLSALKLTKEGSSFRTAKEVTQDKIKDNKVVVLSKGENIIAVEIKLGKDKAVYKLKVNYDGGPQDDPNDLKQKIIPGIYCPTMRKLSQAEKDNGTKNESLLIIYMAGKCYYCQFPLKNMGKKHDKIADKFKTQGFRAVAISMSGTNLSDHGEARKKWAESGKGYVMYSDQNNCLLRDYDTSGFPQAVALQENKLKKKLANPGGGITETEIKRIFKFK